MLRLYTNRKKVGNLETLIALETAQQSRMNPKKKGLKKESQTGRARIHISKKKTGMRGAATGKLVQNALVKRQEIGRPANGKRGIRFPIKPKERDFRF